tara:strand:+ start:52215 stop:52418 length:204 start_codon:yes stop_codon:yes gene_type:complete
MSKRTTNLLGIAIAIIAGTYFNIMLCNSCSSESNDTSSIETSEVVVKNSKVIEKKQKNTLINITNPN